MATNFGKTARILSLLLLAIALVLSPKGLSAQSLKWDCDFKKSKPARSESLVIQFNGARMFSDSEESRLEQKLLAYEDTTATQILVIVVPQICGIDPNQLGAELGQAWGVGGGEFDNGIVIVLKPKTGNSSSGKGQVAIQVGYGLEGAIPDIYVKRTIENIIIPSFREGNFYRGIDKASDQLIRYASGEYSGSGTSADDGPPAWAILLMFAALIFFFIIISRANKGNGGGPTTTYSGRGWSTGRKGGWSMGSGSGWGGTIGGGSGGSSWGGGGGGGSFGGFGGGSFGGGGASGSW